MFLPYFQSHKIMVVIMEYMSESIGQCAYAVITDLPNKTTESKTIDMA